MFDSINMRWDEDSGVAIRVAGSWSITTPEIYNVSRCYGRNSLEVFPASKSKHELLYSPNMENCKGGFDQFVIVSVISHNSMIDEIPYSWRLGIPI